MNKILITIFLLISMNVYAIEVNCSNFAFSAFSKKIRDDLGGICNIEQFKNMVFIDNPNILTVNQYIENGYFFLIDKLNSLVGMPKNIYDYFYDTCIGKEVTNIICQDCMEDDVFERDISNTMLSNQTGFSMLIELPSKCIKQIIYFEDNEEGYRIFFIVLAGLIGLPFAIFIIGLVAKCVFHYMVIPCYKRCNSVDYYFHMKNTKSKFKKLLIKDKSINDYQSINLKNIPQV